MNDLLDDLRKASDAFGEAPFTLEGLERRRRRRHAVQRASSMLVAFTVVALAGTLVWRGFYLPAGPGDTPAILTGRIMFLIGELGGRMEGVELATVLPDGTGRQVLVDGVPEFLTGGWSPDGTQIVFSHDPEPTPDGDIGIWRIDADGDGLVQLTDPKGMDGEAQWSPDGSSILFVRHQDGSGGRPTTGIFLMNPDGSHARDLGAGDDLVHLAARWSPDGTQILFLADDRVYDAQGLRLFVMSADGSDVRELFAGAVGNPQWSDDASEILFQSGSRLLALDVNDSSTREVVGDLPGDVVFRWSPDGSSVLFTRPVGPDRGEQLWVARADGSGAELVAERLEWRDPIAVWSPDGSHIAFNRDGDIWTVTLDSSTERRVTDSPRFESTLMWGPA
jgi:Tol biopolymer transport system component